MFSYDYNPEDLLYIQEDNIASKNTLDVEDQLNIAKQSVDYGFLGLMVYFYDRLLIYSCRYSCDHNSLFNQARGF